MKMVLHIFLKDLRHYWMEITGYLLVCTTWAWREAHPFALRWMEQRALLPILLFGLWVLITVRLVQGECLVGDREFWPTRPYRWPLLMAEKALALVLFLNLPLLIAQFYLLHHARIPISGTLIAGILFLQGMFIVILTFPAAVLASITASLVQWVISVVGLVLAAVVLAWIPWNKLPNGLEGGEDVASWIGFAILVPVMTLVLVWQFARRREVPARWLLGVSLLSIPLCIYLSSTSFVRRISYPQAPTASAVQLSIPDGASGKREFRRINRFGGSSIAIPVVDRALDSDSIVNVDGYRGEFSGPGWHWQSEWLNQSVVWTHASPGNYLSFEIPDEIAENIGVGNTTAKLEIAYTLYQLNHAQMVDTHANEFIVPGVGQCAWRSGRRPFFPNKLEVSPNEISWNGASCVAPLLLPAVRVIQVDAAGDSCPLEGGEAPVPPGHFTYDVQFGTSEMPADFDPNPVHNFGLVASPWIPAIPDSQSQKESRKAYLCRGTRFTVRTGRSVERSRATFDLGEIGSEEPAKKSSDEDDE